MTTEDIYIIECGRCHGPVAPITTGRLNRTRLLQRVMMPVFGPNLIDIVGRPAGMVASFDYSRAFKGATAGLIWTEDNLDRLMTDSRAMIPGSFMFYKQPDAALRQKLIRYLKSPQ